MPKDVRQSLLGINLSISTAPPFAPDMQLRRSERLCQLRLIVSMKAEVFTEELEGLEVSDLGTLPIGPRYSFLVERN